MQTYFSNRKIVVCGNIIESYTYHDKNIGHGFPKPPKKPKPEEPEDTPKQRNEEADRINSNRSKKGCRRLINSNADILTKFVTLTYAENQKDVKQANHDFKTFIQRLKAWLLKHHPDHDLAYVAVIEFQKRGAVHYHVLFNLPFVANVQLNKIWTHGFVKINKIDHVTNVGSYVVKYMTKDERDPRLWGKKMYFTSCNLEKPYEFTKKEEIQLIEETMLAGQSPVYAKTQLSEYLGLMTYEQYNLN